MDNDTKQTPQLTWTSKKMWGYMSLVHIADITIAGNEYQFILDKPYVTGWVARGWVNGSNCLYRDSSQYRTLASLKAEIEKVVAQIQAEDGAK